MKTSKNTDAESLAELLASAKTPEDLQAVEQLVNERAPAEPKTPDTSNRWMVSTLGQVAEFFGLSLDTVKPWRQASPPMPGHHGHWPINEIVRWRESKLKASDIKTAKAKQDLERGAIDLEAKQMELAEKRREMVELAEVEIWAATAIVEFREQMSQLPEVLAAAAPNELKNFVRSETDRIVTESLKTLRRRLETDNIETDYPPAEEVENPADANVEPNRSTSK